MKIAILTNEYPPHIYGGAGVHVEYLSRELARLDDGLHQIHILCFGEQRDKSANLTVEGIDPAFDFASRPLQHSKALDALFRNVMMAGVLKEADIVHCHTWYTHFAGCLLKQMLRVPLVLTTHSLEPHRPWKEEQLGAAYRVSLWLERTAYENADGVVATSESMRASVHELYQVPLEKVRIIPNGIDANQYRPTFKPDALLRYGIRPDKPFILFVGRITRQKGIIHLVRAIRSLLPGMQVVLCAGAPDTEAIGKEMADRVSKARRETANEIVWVEQWVPREDIIVLYSHASIFVCPSIYEPFGIINLEAMACGTPVVASSVGGIPEVVVDGETGFLVPFDPVSAADPEPADPEQFSRDLSRAVNRLFHSEQERKRMGRNARERVERLFSWESVARRTVEFYRELTER